MNNDKKILVFTATYNEKENIEKLILEIKSSLPTASILVIDDNSPDGTGKIVNEIQNKNKDIILLSRDKKLGLDSAHKLAFKYSTENQFDFLITMDADFSHDPSVLNIFVNNLMKYPFVLGSRYITNGKCLMKGSRLFMSLFGNKLIKFISGIDTNEFTTSYRGFNLNKLGKFDLNDVNFKGYSFFMGTIFELHNRKIPIKEIPIIFKDRTKGASKIPKLEIFRTLKNLLLFYLNKIS